MRYTIAAAAALSRMGGRGRDRLLLGFLLLSLFPPILLLFATREDRH